MKKIHLPQSPIRLYVDPVVAAKLEVTRIKTANSPLGMKTRGLVATTQQRLKNFCQTTTVEIKPLQLPQPVLQSPASIGQKTEPKVKSKS